MSKRSSESACLSWSRNVRKKRSTFSDILQPEVSQAEVCGLRDDDAFVGRIAAEKSMALRAPKQSIVDTHLVGVMDGFTGELTLSA
jgi:hypothetical protein